MERMDKKKVFFVSLLIFFVVAFAFLFLNSNVRNVKRQETISEISSQQSKSESQSSSSVQSSESLSIQNSNSIQQNGFVAPISRASERVTKKPFGIFVAPGASPVSPERFRGYHTGADFEIFPEELNQEVSISAVCDGILKVKEYATGYGGVAVEECDLNGSPITVVYGHLKLASIAANVGEKMKAGENIGILGAAYSTETDGERKHLHLGFHRGTAISILGYVQNESALSGWIDPCLYVCK